jgi:hypothetical protein
MTTDVAITTFGLFSRLIGSILQLIAVILLFFFFLSLPSFSEFEFRDKIEEIYVMRKGGVCLYHKNFEKETDSLEKEIMSGAIASISIMLERISTTKGKLSVIQKKDKSVLIFSSDYIAGVLISKEELEIIKFLLKKFVHKFESVFRKVLINFDGGTTIFSPTESLVKEIFFKK